MRLLSEKELSEQKYNDHRAFVSSYFGQSLDEIANWYPDLVTKKNALDMLIEEGQYEIINRIIKYNSQIKTGEVDKEASVGFLEYMNTLEELAKRFMFMVYTSIDDTELISQGNGKINAEFRRKDYEEFYYEMDGYKRFITKKEFEDFVNECKNGGLSSKTSIYEMDCMRDSVMYKLYTSTNEYDYSHDDIVTKFLTKQDHPAENYDYTTLESFFNQRLNPRLFSRDHLMYDFFESTNIIDFKNKAGDKIKQVSSKNHDNVTPELGII